MRSKGRSTSSWSVGRKVALSALVLASAASCFVDDEFKQANPGVGGSAKVGGAAGIAGKGAGGGASDSSVGGKGGGAPGTGGIAAGTGGGPAGSSSGGGSGVGGASDDSGVGGTGGSSGGCNAGEECCSDKSQSGSFCLTSGCKGLPEGIVECSGGSACGTEQICVPVAGTNNVCISSNGGFPADATECTDAGTCSEPDRICLSSGLMLKCVKEGCTLPACPGSHLPVWVQAALPDGGKQAVCVCLVGCE